MATVLRCHWCGAEGPYPATVSVQDVDLSDWARAAGMPATVAACADVAACEARQAPEEEE